MSYTDEQIQSVCDVGYEIMGHFTNVQNCLFPSTEIIKGMKAGLSPEEIADNAYYSICNIPLNHTGYNTVGMGDDMHNIACYLRGEILNRIKALGGE